MTFSPSDNFHINVVGVSPSCYYAPPVVGCAS
jgi:hypothetical protein